MRQKAVAPSSLRKVPAIFCGTLTMRKSRSAWLLDQVVNYTVSILSGGQREIRADLLEGGPLIRSGHTYCSSLQRIRGEENGLGCEVRERSVRRIVTSCERDQQGPALFDRNEGDLSRRHFIEDFLPLRGEHRKVLHQQPVPAIELER